MEADVLLSHILGIEEISAVFVLLHGVLWISFSEFAPTAEKDSDNNSGLKSC